MTDNEIIKELNLRIDNFSRETLDLITRQKAEIERLEKIRAKQADIIGEERGQKYELLNKICKAKSEALKELAERLKGKKQKVFTAIHDCIYAVTVDNINSTVKEMTEANENNDT